jgi:precorrin-2/cobalt-factor-2 C20-methyltransferase
MSETRHSRLIGASLGPGDPELITRRAWTVLHSPARWVYPVRQAQVDSYALDIVRRAGVAIPEDAEPLLFPMTHNPQLLAHAWTNAATRCVDLLAQDRDLVFLVEGDASTYATFGHLARAVREMEPAIEVEVIPGVSSFAAAAARIAAPLADEDDTLAVLPAAYGVTVLDHLLDEFDTLVLLKIKPMLDEVLDLLERRGLLAHACLVEKVGAPGERVIEDLAQLRGETVAYLSLLLVRNPGRVRGELHRGCRPRRLAGRVAAAGG